MHTATKCRYPPGSQCAKTASKDHVRVDLRHLLARKGLGRLVLPTRLSSRPPWPTRRPLASKLGPDSGLQPDSGAARERSQMTRSRAVVGRARQTKASTARTSTATSNTEQPDGAGQRKTAADPLTVPGGLELLDVPSRAPSSSSATGDQEGVGRGGRASASDQETPKALRRAIGRTPLDPARTRSRHLVEFSVRRRAQIEVWSLSHHRPHHPVQSRISRPLDADATR